MALKTGDRIRVRDGYAGGGDPGVYRYLGPDASLNPSAQDYSDAAAWVLVAGADDVVYRYMGGTPVTLRPERRGLHRPALLEAACRRRSCRRVNIVTSDSRAIGAAVVLNDVNSRAPRRASTGFTVTAGSVPSRRPRRRRSWPPPT